MSDEIVKNKILLRASDDELFNILSLPLIHSLHSHYELPEIDIIIDEGSFDVFNFLPFEVNRFILPKKKSSLPGIHHFAFNLNDIFNVDYFFDLRGDFKSSFTGLTFKSKERIGFANGLNKLLLTKKIEPSTKCNSDERYLPFFTAVCDEEFDEHISAIGETLDDVYEVSADDEENVVELFPTNSTSDEDRSFIVIFAKTLFENETSTWTDFFESFVGKRFVVVTERVLKNEADDDYLKEMKEFLSTLDDRNKYILAPEAGADVIKTLLGDTSGVVSDINWCSILSAYAGKKTFGILRGEMPDIRHFVRNPFWVTMKGGVPYKALMLEESKSLQDVTQLIDLIEEQFST